MLRIICLILCSSLTLKLQVSATDEYPSGYTQLRTNNSVTSCQPNEVFINESTCQPCLFGYWPNNEKSDCNPVPIIYSKMTQWQVVLGRMLASIGILFTTLTAYVFFKYRNTPVVKASSRELCYLMLIGVFQLHIISLTSSLLKPSLHACMLIETMPSIGCTIVYVSLLVKTNRIARLLAISEKKFPDPHPKFMSLKAQLVITFILVAIIVTISITSLSYMPPQVHRFYITNNNDVYANMECVFSGRIMYFCLVYKTILVALGTYYAVKTRNIPENFREAKCIAFLMYFICINNVCHTLIHFGSDFKLLAMTTHISSNALAVVVILFFPKLYIILWLPEKNTRKHFTTTDIRLTMGRPHILLKELPIKIIKSSKNIIIPPEQSKQKIIHG